MTTPEGRNERREEVRRIVRAVRASSGPELSDDAATRIADGAWERARAAGPATTGGPGNARGLLSRPFLSHRLRRWSIAAAILIAIGGGALVLRPTEAAFAIDGDPVKVLRGNQWVEESHSVPTGATVYVADGVRSLRGPGARIVPEPGSTFRIVRSDGEFRFHVEILGGAAEVMGDAVRLSLGDVEVRPTPASSAYHVWASAPGTTENQHAPQLEIRTEHLAHARFAVRMGSTARLVRHSTGEALDLSGDTIAALLPVPSEGTQTFRLGRLENYTPSVAVRIAMGEPLVNVHDCEFETVAVLRGLDEEFHGYTIASDDLTFALDDIKSATMALVSRMGRRENRTRLIFWDASAPVPLEDEAAETGETITELVHELDGTRRRALIRQDGSVLVETDSVAREFRSLDDARAADPGAFAVFDQFLEE